MRYIMYILVSAALSLTACARCGDGERQAQGCIEGNCVSGTGRFAYPTGVYAGQFKAGVPHGEGVYTFSNGDRYEGFNINFKKESYGTYHYHTGDRYVGEWKNDRREGYGIYYYAGGDRYVGEWSADVKKGKGTYHYANGDRYVGPFTDDRPHGRGVKYGRDGSVKSGWWVYGVFAEGK